MKKKIPNSYEDWNYSDKVLMHSLKLKWSGAFVWSNFMWLNLFSIYFFRSFVVCLLIALFSIVILGKVSRDVEFTSVDKPVDK